MKASFQATFREKSRHMSFVALCIGLLFSVVLMIPNGSGVMRAIIINPATYAQANNASWSAISVAFMMGFFLPLIGAAFLRNAIRLDRDNGTMTLFLTSRFARFKYTAGKFFSNLCLMLIFWGIVLTFSLIGTLVKYQGNGFNLVQFFLPFLILLPGIIFVSALTLVTETLPGLRGRIGTAAVIIFLVLLYTSDANFQQAPSPIQHIFNVSGTDYLITNIKQAVMQSSGHQLTLLKIIGASTSTQYTGHQNLVFSPLRLTETDLLAMGTLILISCGLVYVAGLLLERRPLTPLKLIHWKVHLPVNILKAGSQSQFYLSFRLLTGGVTNYWLSIILLIWLWNWLTPYQGLTQFAFPILFLTAMPLFAELGAGEVQSGVYQWLQTLPNGHRRQTVREMLIGSALSVALALPALIKAPTLMVSLALLVWSLQLPVLAQLLGRLTASKRPIQLLMVVFFYLYLNGAPLLSFNQTELVLPTLIYLIILIFALVLLLIPKISFGRKYANY